MQTVLALLAQLQPTQWRGPVTLEQKLTLTPFAVRLAALTQRMLQKLTPKPLQKLTLIQLAALLAALTQKIATVEREVEQEQALDQEQEQGLETGQELDQELELELALEQGQGQLNTTVDQALLVQV